MRISHVLSKFKDYIDFYFFFFFFTEYELFDMSTSGTTCEMVSNVITVEFLCPGTPNYESIGIKRKLLKDMELQKVLGLVQRLFKKGKIPTLSFVQKNVRIPTNLTIQLINNCNKKNLTHSLFSAFLRRNTPR